MDESQALALLAGAYAARRRSGASVYVYIFRLKQAMQNIANRATVPAHSGLHGRPGGDRCCRTANEMRDALRVARIPRIFSHANFLHRSLVGERRQRRSDF